MFFIFNLSLIPTHVIQGGELLCNMNYSVMEHATCFNMCLSLHVMSVPVVNMHSIMNSHQVTSQLTVFSKATSHFGHQSGCTTTVVRHALPHRRLNVVNGKAKMFKTDWTGSTGTKRIHTNLCMTVTAPASRGTRLH